MESRGRPERMAASVSFNIKCVTSEYRSSGNSTAGAGFRITTLPAACALLI